MKNIILILGILFVGTLEASQPTKKPISFLPQVSAGGYQTCAIDDEGVKCWGRDEDGQINVPQLTNPIQVSSGYRHACALDDEGLKCWGWKEYGQTYVPQLKNPVQVSAGIRHTCAIDVEGLKCWGDNFEGLNNVPQIKNPIQVSAGGHHTCAIADEGLKCWGNNGSGQIDVPQLKNPVQVSAGYQHTCAIDDEGVKCWGRNEYGLINVPQLKNPIQVSAGFYHTCALDDEGVKCWGWNGNGQIDLPELKNPVQVSAGESHTCAIDDEGLKCWGNNGSGQIDVPQLKYYSMYLYLAIKASAYSKSTYLSQLETFHKRGLATELDVKKQLLLCLIISPLILGTDSDYFNIYIIPKFNSTMRRLYEQINLPKNQSPLPEIEATLENRKIAITAIQSSLDVSLSFLSGQQIERTQDALRKVGQAMIDPMNDQNLIEALKSVESLKEERAVLLSSEKSKFLIECQQVALDWLKLKVK